MTVLVLAGTLLGTSAAYREINEPEPVAERVFYAANHELLVEPTADAVNLDQLAHLLTGGDLPTLVAEQLDRNRSEVIPRLATVFDRSVNSLTLSGVGETPEEALELTNTVADALIAYLLGIDQLEYEEVLAAAETTAAENLAELEALDAQIDQLEPGLDATGQPVEQSTAQATQLELLTQERSATVARYQAALTELDAVRVEQVPLPVLYTFEISEPFTISRAAYDERIAAGRIGEATYDDIRDLPSGGSSGLFDASGLAENPIVLIVAGALAGLLLGIIAVATLTRLDHRILSRGEAEEHFGLPVIAEIPRYRRRDRKSTELVAHTERMSHIAEAYRSLRSSLVYNRLAADEPEPEPTGSEGAQVVMVTSPTAGEGKTTVTANLAVVMAEAGQSVLAVNCDYRRPKLAFHLGGDHSPRRVSETLVPDVVMVNHATDEGAASVPSEAIEAQRHLIERARQRGDHEVILLDTAPLLATNDANELISTCDLVLIVAHLGRTTKEAAETTRNLLNRRAAPVAGVVLVGTRDTAVPKRYYYYSSDVAKRASDNGSGPVDVAELQRPTADATQEPDDRERDLVGVSANAAETADHSSESSLPIHAMWHDPPGPEADNPPADEPLVSDPDPTLAVVAPGPDTATGKRAIGSTIVRGGRRFRRVLRKST